MLAAFIFSGAAPAPLWTGSRPTARASGFAADLTGGNDATAAISSCLNAAGPGGICEIDPGGIVKIRIL
jgi:hypothetical protein